jgi:hypothetical protein
MVGTPGLATTLQETDQLDGGEVLPAFAYPVSELFT